MLNLLLNTELFFQRNLVREINTLNFIDRRAVVLLAAVISEVVSAQCAQHWPWAAFDL